MIGARVIPAVVCTLGTTTDEPAVLAGMAAAGMGLARINTAYAGPDAIARRLELLAATGVPAMLDLKGRQLRVDCTTVRTVDGVATERPVRYPIAAGDVIAVGFGTGPVRFNHVFGGDLSPGDTVLFDNGTIRTTVVDPEDRGLAAPPNAVLLVVEDAGAGKMTPGMGANVPGKRLHVPSLTDRDRAAITVGVEHDVAWYALSFVQVGDDLATLHEVLLGHGDVASGLVAKIEDEIGIAELDAICAAARATSRPFAVMVGRGDLFVELDPLDLFDAQRRIVDACLRNGVPAMVATGVFASMTDRPAPTRAEVCDAAAALAMGAVSLMLSDETSNSRYPVQATRALAAVVRRYGLAPVMRC